MKNVNAPMPQQASEGIDTRVGHKVSRRDFGKTALPAAAGLLLPRASFAQNIPQHVPRREPLFVGATSGKITCNVPAILV